jgi:hypothetical protein
VASDEINPIDLFMKAIETLLITDPDKDENTAGYACCQSGDIDEREKLMTSHVPECDFYIVFQHDSSK